MIRQSLMEGVANKLAHTDFDLRLAHERQVMYDSERKTCEHQPCERLEQKAYTGITHPK
jgi:hypothetical protein